ncbi:hypothetical protein PPL_02749 [Heterostelium album PN500]|uniref:Ankyrin repeat-containing protein n=1 Tax=Heterostelium pallidum (strain ATCC 26659 / Pp 5 / PN500) TaxID=670386 RepID=D3B2Y4_HETP5|nr:hypothetical protein PPL_02749 [Heterostelium album PN500]EFA83682.1 hypothetical protein PPL_02749 [Heterostelium album PN500]|eukprot:XP_020435799.1 hypothetical protein PPL_02749 [Heterostelium album PN500]
MDNILFSILFNNKVIKNLIFIKVNQLNCRFERKSYKWCEVLKLPNLLARYDYFDLLKSYLMDKSNPIPTNSQEIFGDIDSIVACAIKGGSFDMFQYLLAYFQIDRRLQVTSEKIIISHLSAHAARYNRLDIIHYVIDRFGLMYFDFHRALTEAPYSGNLELLKFLTIKMKDQSESSPTSFYHTYAFETAARVGRINMIEWLMANRLEDLQHSDLLEFALLHNKSGNHLALLEYLFKEHRQLFNFENSAYSVYSTNHSPETFQLLVKNGMKITKRIMEYTVDTNNLDLLKWLHSNTTYQCSQSSMNRAAKAGNLEMVRWLNENRTEGCSSKAMDEASVNGHLHVVKWLHYNRSEGCTTRAMDFCCNEIEYDSIFDKVEDGTTLKIIQFLHENRSEGCTDQAYENAGIDGKLEVVKFLYTNRTERYSDIFFDTIATCGHVEMLEWFEQQPGIEITLSDDILHVIIEPGKKKLETVKYLYSKNGVNNRFGFSREIMDLAIENECLGIMKWFHVTLPELCTNNKLKSSYSKLKVLRWLLEHPTQYNIKSIDVKTVISRFINEDQFESLEWHPFGLEVIHINGQLIVGQYPPISHRSPPSYPRQGDCTSCSDWCHTTPKIKLPSQVSPHPVNSLESVATKSVPFILITYIFEYILLCTYS